MQQPLDIMSLFDARTLLLAGALVAGTFALVMCGVTQTRKTYPGFGTWAAAELAFALALFLQALRGLVPGIVSVIFGSLAAACALILLVQGTYKFCGRRVAWTWIYLVCAAFLSGVSYFYFVRDDLRLRTLVTGVYLAVMAAYCAIPFLRVAPRGRRFGYYFAATVLVYGSVVGSFRVLAVARMDRMTALFLPTPIHTLFYITILMFIIGITFSFSLLTNDRYVSELSTVNLSLAEEIEKRAEAEKKLRSEIEQRRALEVRLQDLVHTDALTGVLNRRGLQEALQQEIKRAERFNRPFSLLVLDVDYFKRINDTFGHACGDELLNRCVTACRQNLRAVDTIARSGGDEFAVLLVATDLAGATIRAEKLRRTVEETTIHAGSVAISTTISIGIARWERGDSSGDSVSARADRALYSAKNAGRNCICLASTGTEPEYILKSPSIPDRCILLAAAEPPNNRSEDMGVANLGMTPLLQPGAVSISAIPPFAPPAGRILRPAVHHSPSPGIS